ncbi:peptidoglycan DD-metalloendopeptidase family protein [Treponema pedis]|nr:peptidoglycan DD-metalloendopeptidase family protein [Treponema pedis]
MKKSYCLITAVFGVLFLAVVAFTVFNGLQLKAPVVYHSETGMGGGDSRLPTFRPDEEISEITVSPLDYRVYSVKRGDMVGEIAAKYGVSQDSIISVNKLKNTRSLQIGQLLKIPSMDGIVYTVKKGDTPEKLADSYKISLEKLALVNNISDNNMLKAGAVVFLPDAKLDWVTLQEINGDLFKIPIHGRYRISSRYGWRRDPFTGLRSFHNGIDLATYKGAPIYAALAGTVVATGYSNIYGNYVIVRHHSGYQTLYGHLNTILTKRGQYVTNQTRIGSVGTTGRSTGPHLHFTVYKNGATINPAAVWN